MRQCWAALALMAAPSCATVTTGFMNLDDYIGVTTSFDDGSPNVVGFRAETTAAESGEYVALCFPETLSSKMYNMDCYICYDGATDLHHGWSENNAIFSTTVKDHYDGSCSSIGETRVLEVSLGTEAIAGVKNAFDPTVAQRVGYAIGTQSGMTVGYGAPPIMAGATKVMTASDAPLVPSDSDPDEEPGSDEDASGFSLGPFTVASEIDTEANSIAMTVTASETDVWFAVAFAPSASMVGGDVFYCDNTNIVHRTFNTARTRPAPGSEVPGSTCDITAGTMSFTRSLDSTAPGENAVGTEQQTMQWAVGPQPAFEFSPRHSSKGSASVNLASGSTAALSLNVPVQLYLHAAFMAIAWGGLLPWGALMANRLRFYGKAGTWYKLHRNVQILGWVLQLVGFAMGVWHCQKNSLHLANAHAWVGLVVVGLGTLQPTAVFRPKKPEEGQPKGLGRKLWEWSHKGVGWVCILVGVVNIALGAVVAYVDKNFAAGILAMPALGGVGVLSALIFAVVATLQCGKAKRSQTDPDATSQTELTVPDASSDDAYI